jgi:DNA-binding response OmpR family regulator
MPKVLIVEDDFMIADCLEEILLEGGYEVCGIAGNVADALALAELEHPDFGIIDIHLGNGRSGTEVAVAIRRRGPFGVLYATGNPHHPALDLAEGEGCISKPYTAHAILAALVVVSDAMARMALPRALPKGFRLLGV